jgi:hypothetical protein
MIRKMVLTMVVVGVSLIFNTQQGFASDAGSTLSPVEQQYQIIKQWMAFNNWDKEKAYVVLNEVNAQLRIEFPLDVQLFTEADNFRQMYLAKLNQKAKEMGFEDYEQAIFTLNENNDPRGLALENELDAYRIQESDITKEWYKENNRRYCTAAIDAIKRIMENANTMK